MNHQDVGYENVKWYHLDQDRVQFFRDSSFSFRFIIPEHCRYAIDSTKMKLKCSLLLKLA